MTQNDTDGGSTVDAGDNPTYARHKKTSDPDGVSAIDRHGRTAPMTTIAPTPPDPAQIRRIDEVFAARGAFLVRAAHALTGSRPDAEDLLQEAFVRALARPEVFDGRSDAEAAGWLWIVMRRLWRDRQRGGLGKTSPMPAAVEQRLVDTAPPIPDQLLRDWQLAVLYEGLARLGPRHRTAMVLLGRGLGEVESAEAAGVSRRTMREWRRDARRALGVFGERLDQGTICDSLQGHLSAYADNELGPGKQRTQLEAHLAHCAPCRAALERVRTHTRTLGTVLPVAASVAIEDHARPEGPVHIGHAIEVLGPPHVIVGGPDGVLAYAEAHWRLVATTAIIALTGWAMVSHALTGLTGTGTPLTHPTTPAAARRNAVVLAPTPIHLTPQTATAPKPHRDHARGTAHPPARATAHATAPISVSAYVQPTTRVAVFASHRTAARATSSTCTSAACLFGP
jgi:RNA polymerase sigma-70 factor (ECF subfamily)